MIIRRQFQFDAAHMLSQYEGKCANLHGHTYTGDIEIRGLIDDTTGMLLDYNVIKEVVDEYDHCVIFSAPRYRDEAEEELREWCMKWGMKYKFISGKCTAEWIAENIAGEIATRCDGDVKVRVWLHETPGSTAIGVYDDD